MGHYVLMAEPPGSEKILWVRALPGILPETSIEASLDVTRIHSVANQLPAETPLISHRRFRAPYQRSSHVGLAASNNTSLPGEVSLAQRGVLFLDEFPEFGMRVLEGMRQPMEDKVVNISRTKGSLRVFKLPEICSTPDLPNPNLSVLSAMLMYTSWRYSSFVGCRAMVKA